MANKPDHQPIEKIVPLALANYLKTAIPTLMQAYDEFPDPNMAVQMPSVSVFASSNAKFSPGRPYPDVPPDPNVSYLQGPIVADINNKALVHYVVGIYDFGMQVDLWAHNKEERDQMSDLLFNALNPYIDPMGLDLKLTDYFNQWANYLYIGHTVQDSAERSERGEWRVTYSLLVTCKAIRERTEFIITDPSSAQQIADTSEISTSVVVPD